MATHPADVLESPLTRYTRWSLVITVAAMPTYVLRFKLLVPTQPLEILMLVTIALYVASRIQARSWHPQRTPLEIPTALLLIAGAIAIAVSPDHVGALGLYRAYFIEPVALFYVAIDVLRSRQHLRLVLLGFAVASTIFAILNLGAWAIALLRHETIATGNAPEALQTSPNAVAMFLEPPLAFAAGFILYATETRDRIIALVATLFMLPALLLTLSRAAWLTLAVLALVAVITLPQTRLKLAVLGTAVVGGLVMLQIPYVATRLANQLDPNYRENTFEGRLRIWSDTLHMLADHPILGAGLRAYKQVMVPYVTGTRGPELYPHNVYLTMWSELGLLGLVAFVALLVLLLWLAWRGYVRATGFYRPLLWGAGAAVITVAVHGVFDTPYFKNDLAVEFWVVAFVVIAALKAMTTRDPALER